MKKLFLALLLGLAACGKSNDPTATASTEAVPPSARAGTRTASVRDPETITRLTPPSASLPDRLACLRQSGGMMVIGHRGGPTRTFPANALESLQRTYRAGTHGMEVDVAQSRDGKLYLMHDDRLDRATDGRGPPDSLSWAEVEKLTLRAGRRATAFHPASLDAVLDWAVANHALIELDRKTSTSLPAMVDAVRRAHAEGNVLIVTYTDAQALEVHATAPDLAIVAAIHSEAQLDGLLRRGLKPDRLVAWTGAETPNPDLWKALARKGVSSAFGTLGPRGKSLDSTYWADGDGGEYRQLAADGLALLVTDLTDKVSREIPDEREKSQACGF